MLHDLQALPELNGTSGTVVGPLQGERIPVEVAGGKQMRVRPQNAWLARCDIPSTWFSQDTAVSSIELGVAANAVDGSIEAIPSSATLSGAVATRAATITLDQGEDTAPLLQGLQMLRSGVQLDESMCERLLAPVTSSGVTRWAALARHAGATSLVDEFVRQVEPTAQTLTRGTAYSCRVTAYSCRGTAYSCRVMAYSCRDTAEPMA